MNILDASCSSYNNPKPTFLSFRVWLDFQHHSSDSISIHVIERVCYPLKQNIKREGTLGEGDWAKSLKSCVRSTAGRLDLTAYLEQHHASLVDQSDVFKDLQSVLLSSVQLLHIAWDKRRHKCGIKTVQFSEKWNQLQERPNKKRACIHDKPWRKSYLWGSSGGTRAVSKVLWRGWPGTVSLCSWPALCTLQNGHIRSLCDASLLV